MECLREIKIKGVRKWNMDIQSRGKLHKHLTKVSGYDNDLQCVVRQIYDKVMS